VFFRQEALSRRRLVAQEELVAIPCPHMLEEKCDEEARLFSEQPGF
jgi:hypothetical protein